MATPEALRKVADNILDVTHGNFTDLTVKDLEYLYEAAEGLANLVREIDDQMNDGDPPEEWVDAFRQHEE